MKEFLNIKTIKFFFSLKHDDIKQKFNNPSFSDKTSKYINDDSLNNLFYYDNYQVIDNKLIKTLEQLDKNLAEKCYDINGTNMIFSDNKIIFIIYENGNYIINVGYINQNDKLVIESLIQNEDANTNKEDLQIIYNTINKSGYNNFNKKYIKNGEIKIQIKKNFIKAKIYKLSSEENIFNLETNTNFKISQKLKAILILSLSQNIDIDLFHLFNNEKIEKVYLINYNYLLKYKYEEINSIIKNNNNIKELIEEYNNHSTNNHSEFYETILSKLNKNDLIKIDQEIQNIDLSKENWEALSDIVQLKNKKLNIFKEFILVRDKFFNEIKNILCLPPSKNNVNYIYKNTDIISINDKYQNIIVSGNIDLNNHLFNVLYIFDFDKEKYLKDALNIIQTNNIDYYMKEKTVFDEENCKDFVSPIFGEKNEYGFCYKYEEGINYADLYIDYEKYLNNENLSKIMKLYNYYYEFKQKMIEKNNKDKSYYLINKNIMNSIKKDFNYDKIIETLNQAQFILNEKNNKKKMLYIIKHLDNDILEGLKNYQFKKYLKDFTSPEKINITIPNSQNESIQIFNDFEIIDSSLASEFISDDLKLDYDKTMKFEKNENLLECSLKDGRVIIYYKKNKTDIYKYIYVIGILDNKNTFKIEYICIYKKDYSQFNEIKNNLNNYFDSISQQFISGIFQLKNKKKEEIGKIINFDKLGIQYINKMKINEEQHTNKDNENLIQNEINISEDNKDNNDNNNEPQNEQLDPMIIVKYNLNAQIQKKSIKDNFLMPPLIGLDNIGATCYMNATLQCLCNIPKFVNYIKYNKHFIEYVKNDLIIGNNSLSSSFKLLIEQLWPDRLYNKLPSYAENGGIGSNNSYSNKKNESIAPNDFKEKISNMNELFKGVAANDAKDLVQFLIMTIHKELNSATNQNNNNILNNDQTNKQLMFKIFTQDFMNTNKSIISDLFYGVNYNIIQCQGCSAKSFNYQTYFFFVFPLEEIRIYKNQNNVNQNFNGFNFNPNFMNFNNNFNINMNNINNEINIYDCFSYEQRITYMTGDNAMHCNYCRNTCPSSMCTLLAFGPEIIIIILNRGQGIQFKVKINFFEELNLNNYIEYKETGVMYNLIGVITHMGGSDMSGHFIAYCKNPIDNTWYQYNDSVINQVNNFKTEVIDYATPYLLFYQKVGK